MNMDLCRRTLSLGGEKRPREQQQHKDDDTPLQKEFKRRMLSTLCNVPLEKLTEDSEATGILTFGGGAKPMTCFDVRKQAPLHAGSGSQSSSSNNIMLPNPYALDMLRTMKVGSAHTEEDHSQQSVASKVLRKVPSAPVRILDAPDIVDDYYLNLISWSKDNILAVALAKSVYLWNATTGEIHHLVTVTGNVGGGGVDYITSVSWCQEPGHTKYIAVGTHMNEVQIFDGHALKKIRTLHGATGRIASLSWTSNMLSAGDRDATIINHDVRADQNIVSKYMGHTQEVCGLRWNDDGSTLASGGNENFLCLWDAAMSARRNDQRHFRSGLGPQRHAPRLILKQHKAAVKALDWCPFHRGLLASGGGTADRSIKFWNSSSGAMLNSVDTGSQVCSLVWNRHQREICSSHGYSENQLILWKYPTMTKIKELTGHTARVLNMDISPDGASIVSAGADETLRFWNIFDTPLSMRMKAGGKGGLAAAAGDFASIPLVGRRHTTIR
jgi:cell division cycle protein 20 (cofactor of APC complex)